MVITDKDGPNITDKHVGRITKLEKPRIVCEQIRTTSAMRKRVEDHRKVIEEIMHGHDDRFMLIAGPCSIFNRRGTIDFAEAFLRLSERVKETMFLVMRCPPDKPRTISKVGQWEGMLHEPDVVGQHDPNTGIRRTREILVELASMGVPLAIELLDTRRTQYFDDLLSLSWTGARAVEYGALRRQGSGLSWPIGFKNRTDGELKPAFDAIESANHPNYFDGMDEEGDTVVIDGSGNANACLIMRGSERASGRNFDRSHVEAAQNELRRRNLLDYVLVDSAHGNSLNDKGKKDHRLQLEVFDSTIAQRLSGNTRIGAMLEAYLREGKQEILPGMQVASLPYDLSPTDPTVSLPQFEAAVLAAHQKLLTTKSLAA